MVITVVQVGGKKKRGGALSKAIIVKVKRMLLVELTEFRERCCRE